MPTTLKTRLMSALKAATAVGAIVAFGGAVSIGMSAFAFAAQHEEGGHDSGSSKGHQGSGGHDTDTEHGEKGGKAGKGRAPGEAGGGSHGSLEDIFRDIAAEEDEDSDRPDYAGQQGGPPDKGGKPSSAGSKRGDLFGDLWVILRDEDGVPILTPEGFVQPLDAAGNLIPLDAEGAPLDPTLVVEVELGRLNVGRSPSKVLDQRASEVIDLLNNATAISLDPAGRLVVTVDGTASTIDSPLENLAIYIALMTTGSIPGVSDLPGDEFDYLVDGAITPDDLLAASSFLAASSDKSDEITSDEVAYISAFLGVNTTTIGDVTYTDFDFDDFTYDRSDAYEDVTAVVLVEQPDGSFVPTTVNIYEAVFNSVDYTGSETLDAFTQSAEDARAVVDYLHTYETR